MGCGLGIVDFIIRRKLRWERQPAPIGNLRAMSRVAFLPSRSLRSVRLVLEELATVLTLTAVSGLPVQRRYRAH